eukprot:TRINITY_DN12633_c1_g1_i1.p1 TRINITY_DN12633_c1_g1~~TRINITY_DN12633_c1_g1_i1.p1  ORF type:complete len:572 (+),score=184.93 TRINITY_DN12633_c1_g1_i1:155-1717(+)
MPAEPARGIDLAEQTKPDPPQPRAVKRPPTSPPPRGGSPKGSKPGLAVAPRSPKGSKRGWVTAPGAHATPPAAPAPKWAPRSEPTGAEPSEPATRLPDAARRQRRSPSPTAPPPLSRAQRSPATDDAGAKEQPRWLEPEPAAAVAAADRSWQGAGAADLSRRVADATQRLREASAALSGRDAELASVREALSAAQQALAEAQQSAAEARQDAAEARRDAAEKAQALRCAGERHRVENDEMLRMLDEVGREVAEGDMAVVGDMKQKLAQARAELEAERKESRLLFDEVERLRPFEGKASALTEKVAALRKELGRVAAEVAERGLMAEADSPMLGDTDEPMHSFGPPSVPPPPPMPPPPPVLAPPAVRCGSPIAAGVASYDAALRSLHPASLGQAASPPPLSAVVTALTNAAGGTVDSRLPLSAPAPAPASAPPAPPPPHRDPSPLLPDTLLRRTHASRAAAPTGFRAHALAQIDAALATEPEPAARPRLSPPRSGAPFGDDSSERPPRRAPLLRNPLADWP